MTFDPSPRSRLLAAWHVLRGKPTVFAVRNIRVVGCDNPNLLLASCSVFHVVGREVER